MAAEGGGDARPVPAGLQHVVEPVGEPVDDPDAGEEAGHSEEAGHASRPIHRVLPSASIPRAS